MTYTPAYHIESNGQHGHGQVPDRTSYSYYPSHRSEGHFAHYRAPYDENRSNFTNGFANHPDGPLTSYYAHHDEYANVHSRNSDHYQQDNPPHPLDSRVHHCFYE